MIDIVIRSERLRRALFLILISFSSRVSRAESEEEAYSRVISERAATITQAMTFADSEQASRVQKLIANQYRTLRKIHAKRDVALTDARQSDSESDERASSIAAAKLAMFEAHNHFLAQLRAELDCDQVEQVKDGLTYGVLDRTYDAYLAKLPNMQEDEKRTIRALLIEARELAMDGGSADEKHEIFRKYKGKINNYLSAAGYKL